MTRPASARRWNLVVPCLCAWILCGPAAHTTATPPPARPDPVRYFIIVSGEELLRGVYPDGHTHFLTRTLGPMGCQCVGSLSVDDKPADLKAALGFALNHAPLVIVTGGLGPTANDITRDTLAEVAGDPLHEHPDVLAELERRFHTPRDRLRDNLRRQTRVPVCGTHLKNPHGSAVGLVFELTNAVVVALPGPPRELQPMVTGELAPYLRSRFGTRPPGSRLTLRFVGIGQSQIDQVLRDHVSLDPDLFVSSLFDGSRVDFMFSLPGDAPADRARLKRLESQLLRHLGDFCYAEGDRTLEQAVAATLRARGGSLVLAEVGSGGHLADGLGRAEDVAGVLIGAYVAPSETRLKELLKVPAADWAAWTPGSERVKEIGRRVQRHTGSAWTVVVGDIIRPSQPPPDGRSPHCWVAFGFSDGHWNLQQLDVRGSGQAMADALTTQILDRWRRALRARP
ncbi:MAG: CinA family protein [Verrucomicrobia bacterium]|nr:CinA family protein [Verrucomicrobiota bacterium]